MYKSLIILLVLGLIGAAYYVYVTNTYVTAEFKDLRPFHDRAPIFYNGFKIGKVVKVKPNKTYTSTIVTMELHPDDLKLPINISAVLKKEKNRHDKKFDYIDIIYPEQPSSFYLKDGDRISGKTTVELESYLANQDSDSLEAIKADFAETVKNMNVTIETLGDLFATLNSMVIDVKPNVVDASSDLRKTTSDFAKVSENIYATTGNFNSAFNNQNLGATADNVRAVSQNITVMTQELNRTIPQIACTINEVNKILCNVDEMTEGLNCTMKKPFGGLRLIFGSPVGKKNCSCD